MFTGGSFDTSPAPGVGVFAARPGANWPEVLPRVSRAFFDFDTCRREAMRQPHIYLNFARGVLNICPGLECYAIEALRAYIALRPRDAEGYLLLGATYAAVGAMKEAAVAYEAALEIEPENERAATILIYIYLLMKASAHARHRAEGDA